MNTNEVTTLINTLKILNNTLQETNRLLQEHINIDNEIQHEFYQNIESKL